MRKIKIDKMKILAIVLCIAIIGGAGFVIDQLSTVPNMFEPANHELSPEIIGLPYVLNTTAIKLTLYNNCSQRLFNCIANMTSPVKAVASFGTLETYAYMNLTITLPHPLPPGTNGTAIIIDVYGYGIS